MNETTLFQRTLMALGATIIAPLFVAATGVGGNDMSVQDRVQEYVSVAVAPSTEEPDEQAQNGEAKPEDDKDQANKEEQENAEKSNEQQPEGYAEAKADGTYTVKEGDTYGCIAENYYGSYDQWSRVYAENAGWPGFDEYRLDVGATLQMPAVDSSQVLPKTNLCE